MVILPLPLYILSAKVVLLCLLVLLQSSIIILYSDKFPIQPTPAVRAAAFTLFGTLSRFGSGPSEGPFFEQIQTNFVSLLLHLNESDPVVVVVSLFTVK